MTQKVNEPVAVATGSSSQETGRLSGSWKRPMLHLLKVVATFHLVALTWVFFRAGSLGAATLYLKRLLCFWKRRSASVSFDWGTIVLAVGAVALLLLVVDLPQYRAREHTVLLRWPWWLKVLALALLTACLILTRRSQNAAFIYFQF